MPARQTATSIDSVASRIHRIRGQKVMLDEDLAALYGVTTKRFNEQVKRNRARFPADFMFQLTDGEHDALRSQDRKSTRLNSSHIQKSRMPSSA